MNEAEGIRTLHEGFPWTKNLPNWHGWVPSPEDPQQEPPGESVEVCLTYRRHPLQIRVYRQGAVYRLTEHGWLPLEPSAPEES